MSQPLPASGPEARLGPPMHRNMQASESQKLQVNVKDILPLTWLPPPWLLPEPQQPPQLLPASPRAQASASLLTDVGTPTAPGEGVPVQKHGGLIRHPHLRL